MNKKIIGAILSMVLLSFSCNVYAFSWDWLKGAIDKTSSTKLSDTKIGSGLKEALKVGIENTITLLGRDDGYFANKDVKVLLPQAIRKIEPTLRGIGLGPQLDEFVLSMNRAAEKAAPQAADIFSSAIADMSFDDVKKIFEGSDTAATDYLKEKTSEKLLSQFAPVVRNAMDKYAVTQKSQEILTKAEDLPLIGKYVGDINIDKYVSSRALEGLFKVLAQQEEKIRTDPSARVTSLLKDVFQNQRTQ